MKNKRRATKKPEWCKARRDALKHHALATFIRRHNGTSEYEDIMMWVKEHKIPTKVRCVECNKLLKVDFRFCSDENCLHGWIPDHKTRGKRYKVPSKKREARRRSRSSVR